MIFLMTFGVYFWNAFITEVTAVINVFLGVVIYLAS
jgi:hypothetical protein